MQRIQRYVREGISALQMGVSFVDKLRLLRATAQFHLGNLRHARNASDARCYRVHLGGRTQDLWMRTSSGDIFVFYEVFLSDCYDSSDFDFSTARLIIDLGANIGLASLYFAGRAPQARLICVEPVPDNARLLRRNLAAIPNASVIEAAVASESGTLLFDDDRPAWGGRLSSSGRVEVQALSMFDILQQHAPNVRVDLLKIDIEGGEQQMLARDPTWLNHVDCIVAELHPPFTFDEFKKILTRYGFTVLDPSSGTLPTAIRRPGAAGRSRPTCPSLE